MSEVIKATNQSMLTMQHVKCTTSLMRLLNALMIKGLLKTHIILGQFSLDFLLLVHFFIRIKTGIVISIGKQNQVRGQVMPLS